MEEVTSAELVAWGGDEWNQQVGRQCAAPSALLASPRTAWIVRRRTPTSTKSAQFLMWAVSSATTSNRPPPPQDRRTSLQQDRKVQQQ